MLVLLIAQGVASQIHYKPITLSEVVAASPTIVVVEDADPSSRNIVLPAGSVSMEVHLMRLRVVSVVRCPPGQVSPEQIIEVGGPDLEYRLMMMHRYNDRGISISPIYAQYDGMPNTGRRVMFLHPCGVAGGDLGLCMLADGAIESVEALDAVRGLLTVGD